MNATAVKTHISRSDLLTILSNYGLVELIDFHLITTGTVQTNIFLKTASNNYVLRYYENRLLNSVLFEVNLIKYLVSRQYPCPAPQRNSEGSFVGLHNKKPYIIFEFIHGEHIENPSENQRKQLIQLAADLQNISRNYRPSYKQYRWNYNPELCIQLAKTKTEEINTPDSRNKLLWLEQEVSKLILPRSLPTGICHCDFHFSNVLFHKGKIRALIDFDDANYTYLLYDLACLMDPFVSSFNWKNWDKHYQAEDVFNFPEAKKVVTEYMKHRSLNNNEKRHLYDVFKLSILLDCVWYFNRGQAEDFYEKRKIDYLNALGRERFYEQLFG